MEDKIKTLPKYIHRMTEPHRCEHCHERIYDFDDPKLITLFLKIVWNDGQWIIRYSEDGGNESEQIINPNLEIAIDLAK